MKAIVIATLGSKSMSVLSASIDAYVPKDVMIYIATLAIKPTMYPKDHAWVTIPNIATNYGDAYNAIVKKAFEEHDEIIVANDDVVLQPDTYQKLIEDVAWLKENCPKKVGWVVARTDYARWCQLAHQFDDNTIFISDRVSPIFGYVSKEAWVNYAPINWYSDDIQCLEMQKIGYQHYVSRAYVHHAGSQTIGMDNQKNHLDSEAWIKDNKPELHKEWYK